MRCIAVPDSVAQVVPTPGALAPLEKASGDLRPFSVHCVRMLDNVRIQSCHPEGAVRHRALLRAMACDRGICFSPPLSWQLCRRPEALLRRVVADPPSDAARQRGFFAGPEFGTGAEISQDDRVWLFRPRGKLWLKEGGQEKVLARQIEGAHFIARSARGH